MSKFEVHINRTAIRDVILLNLFFEIITRFCARSYKQLVNDCIPHIYFKLLKIDVSSFLGLFP